ncbi:transcriptional regulator [Sporosarcina newyorkensis 2681]|uniref:Transcriptional regulator n=1 Tax=Sporosarcina newyorkensis 2681 TaxID=1027292 RepID=F9DTI5_9BACL|nr:TetR/AcrR family transcriptional regulator [Sporosarcina newyorkensis]EGQ25743.1 transcriptional regulator [Sporosarcina newyorkensis 2681]
MPKQTFFNLPAEKQDNLLNAAKKEFSRVPLHEAVISNIIKSAKIPRGSFYQYFEDLEDLFFYILEEYVKRNNERFTLQLKLNNGDLLDTFISVFQSMLHDFQSEEHRIFFKNAFLNMNHKVGKAFTNHTDLENFMARRSELLELVDTKKMAVENERELLHLMNIIKAVTFQNIVQSFAMQLTPDEALKRYTLEINMLKRGLYQND